MLLLLLLAGSGGGGETGIETESPRENELTPVT